MTSSPTTTSDDEETDSSYGSAVGKPKQVHAPVLRRYDTLTPVSREELYTKLERAIRRHATPELAVLYLMRKYSFDLGTLAEVIDGESSTQVKLLISVNYVNAALEKGIDISFARITYRAIAPYVGLDHIYGTAEAPTFEIRRARLPRSFFKNVVEDMEVCMKVYGKPVQHRDEESRSRFLAPLFNRIVACFQSRLINEPGSIMPGRISSKDRVEYHFKVLGCVVVLFVEVRMKIGSKDERLNAIAQLIAEAEACDYANKQAGYKYVPILVILCDGDGISFQFFSFDPTSSSQAGLLSRGLVDGQTSLHASVLNGGAKQFREFICSLRPICEVIFGVMILGYRNGVDANRRRAEEMGRSGDGDCVRGWVDAFIHVCRAREFAVDGTRDAENGRIGDAETKAEMAMSALLESVRAAPFGSQVGEYDLMSGWDETEIDLAYLSERENRDMGRRLHKKEHRTSRDLTIFWRGMRSSCISLNYLN